MKEKKPNSKRFSFYKNFGSDAKCVATSTGRVSSTRSYFILLSRERRKKEPSELITKSFQFSPSAIRSRSIRVIRVSVRSVTDVVDSAVFSFLFISRGDDNTFERSFGFREFGFEPDVRRMPGPQKRKVNVVVKGEFCTVRKS